MKVRVELFGTLSKDIHDYSPEYGLTIEVPAEAAVGELLGLLELPARRIGMVVMDGRLVNAKDKMRDGAHLKVFQPIFGG
jgi:sulfur carrier protein ThiS